MQIVECTFLLDVVAWHRKFVRTRSPELRIDLRTTRPSDRPTTMTVRGAPQLTGRVMSRALDGSSTQPANNEQLSSMMTARSTRLASQSYWAPLPPNLTTVTTRPPITIAATWQKSPSPSRNFLLLNSPFRKIIATKTLHCFKTLVI